MKKNLFVSFCFALAYMLLSNILFHNSYLLSTDVVSIGTLLLLPAILIFGAGYAGGSGAARTTGIILFAVIWLLFFIMLIIWQKVYSAIRQNKS